MSLRPRPATGPPDRRGRLDRALNAGLWRFGPVSVGDQANPARKGDAPGPYKCINNEHSVLQRLAKSSGSVGVMGGLQRVLNDSNNSLVESIIAFNMQAGYMEMKPEAPQATFKRATSLNEARGVNVTLALGCYYVPSGEAITPDMADRVTGAALRKLAMISTDLFVRTLAQKLEWTQLANAVAEVIQNTVTEGNFSVERVQPRTHQASVNITKYVAFGGLDFEGPRGPIENGRNTFAMPNDHRLMVYGVFDAVKESEYVFGTVCVKGIQFEVSLDQKVQDFIDFIETAREGNSEMDKIARLFAVL